MQLSPLPVLLALPLLNGAASVTCPCPGTVTETKEAGSEMAAVSS